jgi:tryptophan-rich sensory protein
MLVVLVVVWVVLVVVVVLVLLLLLTVHKLQPCCALYLSPSNTWSMQGRDAQYVDLAAAYRA